MKEVEVFVGMLKEETNILIADSMASVLDGDQEAVRVLGVEIDKNMELLDILKGFVLVRLIDSGKVTLH